MIGWGHNGRSINPGFRFPFEMLIRFGFKVSAIGVRCGLSGTGAGPESGPGAEHLNPGPDG